MLSSFIAVDTETTGLDFEHDRIIELAAVRFEHGIPVADFTALLSPGERALSSVSRLITGITDEELAAAPPITDSLRAFLAFAGETPLVAHNAEFDAHFVRRALEAAELPALPGVWVDSLLLSRIAWPTWEAHRLDYLAEQLQVPRDAEHRALPDARRAGYVFLAAQQHLHGTLTASGWRTLAAISESLSDWSLVFSGELQAGDLGGDAQPQTGASAGGAAVNTGYDEVGIEAEIAARFAATAAGEQWLALEAPVGIDDAAAGLNAALTFLTNKGAGQRVLLAVPDNYAWNALRKNLPDTPVSIAALAEPSGYVCRARLADLASNPLSVPFAERAGLLPLLAWVDRAGRPGEGGSPLGPVADGRGFSPERARVTWSRVHCDAWNDDPAARGARDAAAAAGVIIVTHATLCAHVAREGALLPACDTVIITGAHRFPELAASPAGAGRMISLFRLRDALHLLRPPVAKDVDVAAGVPLDGGAWAELAPRLSDEMRAWCESTWFAPDRELTTFLQKAGKQAGKLATGGDFRVRFTEPVAVALGADPEPVRAALSANEAFLADAAVTLGTAAESAPLAALLHRIAARLRAFRADFDLVTENPDETIVTWIEDGANPHKATLRAAPRAMEPFGDALRALFGAGLFLSPALIAGGSPARDGRWFLRAAGLQTSADSGLPAVRVERLPAPVRPPFFMTPFAPALGAGEQMEAYARFLVEATAPFAARGVLVFCPSQTAVRSLYGALRNVLKDTEGAPRVLGQWMDGNRDAVSRLYAAGRGGFVIASEGIPGLCDAEGAAPALWLLTRMPLPPPRDPVLEARGEPLRDEGRNVRQELWHPAAVLRIKREWAMLHREGAVGPRILWLLDARAAVDGLGTRLGEALGAKIDVARNVEELQGKTGERVAHHNITATQQ